MVAQFNQPAKLVSKSVGKGFVASIHIGAVVGAQSLATVRDRVVCGARLFLG